MKGISTRKVDDLASLGKWSGNNFIKPFGSKGIATAFFQNPKVIYDGYSVKGFKQYDSTIVEMPIKIVPYKVNSLIGPTKFSNPYYFNTNITSLDFYYSGLGKLFGTIVMQ